MLSVPSTLYTHVSYLLSLKLCVVCLDSFGSKVLWQELGNSSTSCIVVGRNAGNFIAYESFHLVVNIFEHKGF